MRYAATPRLTLVSAAHGLIEATSAVRYCADAHPDVVVLDIALPGLGGIEAAKQIHDQCAPPSCETLRP